MIKALNDFTVRSPSSYVTKVCQGMPATFGGHRPCGSGDITVLVCHMILQDHFINGS